MRLPDRNPFSFFTLPLTLLLAGLIVLTAPPGSSRADDPFIKTEDYSTPALPGTRAAANQASGWRNAFDSEAAGSPPATIPEAPATDRRDTGSFAIVEHRVNPSLQPAACPRPDPFLRRPAAG